MEVINKKPIEDSRNFAKDYREELKSFKKLNKYLDVQTNEINGLKSSLKQSGYFGTKNENLAKYSVKDLVEKQAGNKQEIQSATKKLDDVNIKYDTIHKAITSKKIERNPAVYEFLQKNNTVQNNPIKRFFGIEKNFKEVTNKDLKTLLPLLNKEYETNKGAAQKNLTSLKKENSVLSDAISLKNRESNISVTKDKITKSQKELNTLSKPIKKLIESIIDLDLKGIKEALKKTKPMDLAFYVKEVLSKDKTKDQNKVISLGEKLEVLGKASKKEVSLKR